MNVQFYNCVTRLSFKQAFQFLFRKDFVLLKRTLNEKTKLSKPLEKYRRILAGWSRRVL